MRILRAVLAVVVLAFSTTAYAWNNRGHMMVAAIAWDHLDDDAKDRATELLKLNPHYKLWIKDVEKEDRPKIAFVTAATWPDFIKDLAKKPDKAGPGDYVNHGNDPDASPDPNRNMGYEDLFLHKYWHFVDLPFSRDNTPLQQPKKPNALTRIILHRDTIASKTADDDVKSYDLVWLLHLVGDVHQPLHATARFSAASPGGDNGGNDVTLCDDCRSNLHSFWDGAAGSNSSVTAAIKAAEKLDEAPHDEVAITDPAKWIEESFEIAKQSVYRKPIGAGNGPFTVTTTYKNKAREIAEERIALAGARLGKLINDFLR